MPSSISKGDSIFANKNRDKLLPRSSSSPSLEPALMANSHASPTREIGIAVKTYAIKDNGGSTISIASALGSSYENITTTANEKSTCTLDNITESDLSTISTVKHYPPAPSQAIESNKPFVRKTSIDGFVEPAELHHNSAFALAGTAHETNEHALDGHLESAGHTNIANEPSRLSKEQAIINHVAPGSAALKYLDDRSSIAAALAEEKPPSTLTGHVSKAELGSSVECTLSEMEIEASRQIRRKYGLDPPCVTNSSDTSSTESSFTTAALMNANVPSIESYSGDSTRGHAAVVAAAKVFPLESDNQERRANYESSPGRYLKRNHKEEVATLLAVMHSIVRQFVEEFATFGVPVENEHRYLPAFCLFLEIVLNHGWKGSYKAGVLLPKRLNLWSLLERIEKHTSSQCSRGAIENVRQFSGLRSESAKVRIWIRLALMNKCLVPDWMCLLRLERDMIKDCYEEWACMRSDSIYPIISLVSGLDSLDFNLFIKEDDIAKGEFNVVWPALFANAHVNFEAADPSIKISIPRKERSMSVRTAVMVSTAPTTTEPECPAAPSVSDGCVGEFGSELYLESIRSIQRRNAVLTEENQRLRRFQLAQLSQLSLYQDDYGRLQTQLAKMQEQNTALIETNTHFIRKNEELSQIIEAHEETNRALQLQLSTLMLEEASKGSLLAGESSLRNDTDDGCGSFHSRHSLAATARSSGHDAQADLKAWSELEQAFEAEKRAHQLTQEELSKAKETAARAQAECDQTWQDRLRAVQDRLQIVQNLKDEYRRRLRQSNSYHGSTLDS